MLLSAISQFLDRLKASDIRIRLHFEIKAHVKEENISLAPLHQIRTLSRAQFEENAVRTRR